MDLAENDKRVAASRTEDPWESRNLKVRGRITTPPLKSRCIVYDCSERAVHIQSKAAVEKGQKLPDFSSSKG